MGVQLRMIGTGNAFAKRFFNNNAIVEVDGFRLLIDCGITAPYALHRIGMKWNELDAVLITHIHGDHVGGLEEYAFQMRFIYGAKPVLYVPEAIADPLWEKTLRGAMEQDGLDTLDAYFDVRPLREREPARLSDHLTIELFPTKHIPGKPSYAVLINESVFFSSDTTFQPELLQALVDSGRCRHILHECQLSGPGEVHTTLQELLTLPESLQERIWLMHYGDERDSFIGRTGKMRFLEQHQTYVFD